ncbi:MAG TPA: DEAD/DEAH box helicase, partial [Methanoregulaceae archaeon]|nr:DEAD/DEAH box helicase [Methanoregulaceae archaeon]
MTVSSLLQALSEDPSFSRHIFTVKEFPRSDAEYGTCSLSSRISAYLNTKGIRLYRHQAAAMDAAMSGENIVLATSTASGKTLAFLLPVFETLGRDP